MKFIKRHPRIFWTITVLLTLIIVGTGVFVINTIRESQLALRDPNNPAIQYADSHWNWDWYEPDNHSIVSDGSPQPRYECAEFVARALSTQNIFPGMNTLSPQNTAKGNSYGTYKGYHLWNVGVAGFPGLYDYLIEKGYGKDIGNNPSQARPGDVVFYYGSRNEATARNRRHTALLVQTGTTVNGLSTLIDSHNNAHKDFSYNMWETVTIVHLFINDSSSKSTQKSVIPSSQSFVFSSGYALHTRREWADAMGAF
jgi:hypothetical protein